MMKRQLFGLIFLLFPLLAFQCERWTKYAKKIGTNVTPETIELSSDTISFKIHLEPGTYRTEKDETVVILLYALADGDNELLSKIEDTLERPLDRSIFALLKTNERVKNLGLRLQKYQGDRLKIESPILPIAVVQDRR